MTGHSGYLNCMLVDHSTEFTRGRACIVCLYSHSLTGSDWNNRKQANYCSVSKLSEFSYIMHLSDSLFCRNVYLNVFENKYMCVLINWLFKSNKSWKKLQITLYTIPCQGSKTVSEVKTLDRWCTAMRQHQVVVATPVCVDELHLVRSIFGTFKVEWWLRRYRVNVVLFSHY